MSTEDKLIDFHKSRQKSDDFSGPKGYDIFKEATDKLAKDLGGPTYTEWLKDTTEQSK